MKLNIKNIGLSFCLMIAVLMNSQVLMANEGGDEQVIMDINHAKKIITFTDQTFKFNKSTVVIDYFGKKMDIKQLRKNMVAVPVFNVGQRYVGHPTVIKIHLKTIL